MLTSLKRKRRKTRAVFSLALQTCKAYHECRPGYYAGNGGPHESVRAVLECGEDRRFAILFSPRRLGRKENAKAAILAALQNSTSPCHLRAHISARYSSSVI